MLKDIQLLKHSGHWMMLVTSFFLSMLGHGSKECRMLCVSGKCVEGPGG